MKFWILLGSIAALLALGMPSCIIGTDRCDAHQVEVNKDSHSLCVCEPGAVINASGVGCTPCGTNEEVSGDSCVCAPGFARLAADAECEQSELGGACSSEAECNGSFPYCTGADGYCTTRDCTANADCAEGWSCETNDDVRYCKKAPSGLGAPCTSSDDCKAFEASSCDLLQTRTCMLQGCATGDVVCPNEWACCDFSALLGSPLSVCTQPEELTSGSCPFGGSMVTP